MIGLVVPLFRGSFRGGFGFPGRFLSGPVLSGGSPTGFSFQGEGGFGFLRRTGHPVANSREHHVHFRSKDAPEPFSDLKVGMEARAPRPF